MIKLNKPTCNYTNENQSVEILTNVILTSDNIEEYDIYYTVDGSEPITKTTEPAYFESIGATAIKYTAPFDLPLPATLKARAYPKN